MKRHYTYGLFLLFIIYLSGCDPYKQDSFKPQYAVQTYLVANDPMPSVRFFKTSPASGSTSSDEIPDANMTVSEVNNQGTVLNAYYYRYIGGNKYGPASGPPVEAGHIYKLFINIPSDNEPIQAQCIIPGAFHVKLSASDVVKYKHGDGIKLLSTTSTYPGRGAYYVIAAVAEQPDTANLTPYFLNKVKNESYTPTNSLRKVSSKIFSEGDFKRDNQGNLIITVPWDIFAFYGKNRVIVYTLDDNTYDFLRSLDVQYGSTQVTPGQEYNLIYHVKGGIGLFGGLATDTVSVTVTR